MLLLLIGVINPVTDVRTTYTPILEFYAAGKTVRGDGGILGAKLNKKYKAGDEIDILYNENNPEMFRARGKNGMLIGSVIMIVAGAGILAASFIQ